MAKEQLPHHNHFQSYAFLASHNRLITTFKRLIGFTPLYFSSTFGENQPQPFEGTEKCEKDTVETAPLFDVFGAEGHTFCGVTYGIKFKQKTSDTIYYELFVRIIVSREQNPIFQTIFSFEVKLRAVKTPKKVSDGSSI